MDIFNNEVGLAYAETYFTVEGAAEAFLDGFILDETGNIIGHKHLIITIDENLDSRLSDENFYNSYMGIYNTSVNRLPISNSITLPPLIDILSGCNCGPDCCSDCKCGERMCCPRFLVQNQS